MCRRYVRSVHEYSPSCSASPPLPSSCWRSAGREVTQAGLGRRDDLRVGGASPGDRGDAVRGHAGQEGGRERLELQPSRRTRALSRVVDAAVRVRAAAARRPAADQVQVGRQGPRVDRLEHVVLQNEVPGVRPVVGDLAGVVIAHDVRRAARQAHRRRWVGGAAAAAGLILCGPDEPVHLAAVDVRDRFAEIVPGAAVHQAGIVVRLVAALGARVGHAHGELAVLRGNAVGSRVGAEERIERPVLLHDDDDVPDLADAGRRADAEGGLLVQPARLVAASIAVTAAADPQRWTFGRCRAIGCRDVDRKSPPSG